MNKKIRKYLLRLGLLALCMLTATMTLVAPASSRSVAPQQAAVFLSAPYYGSTWLSSIFDHDVRDRYILALTGITADRDSCPCIAPQPCQHPTLPSAYSSCAINDYLYYNGHNGIDYVLRYASVRAAAAGQVGHAGWQFPGLHGGIGSGLGLYVRVDHSNGYRTLYGHMSVLRVRQNDVIPANADEFQRILGISGNTGNSTGPHLHFEVQNANNTPVDPYGPDRNPDHKLWIERPSIDPHVIYTSGNRPLTAPPINKNEPGAFTVDDGDTGFSESPAGCWTAATPAGWAGDHRWRNVPFQNPGNCTATWNFPGTAGRYNVFVYIPNSHATTDAAQYTVHYTESPDHPQNKQDAWAAVNQLAYPNTDHPSSWVYIGTYYLNNQYGTDYVRLESQPLNPVTDMMIAADAVRFAPVVYRTYLPLVLKCYPAILSATPVLNAISNPTHSPNYTVSWQPASGAETYALQEATNPNFTAAVTVYTGSGTSWATTNKPVGTYYYRVRATNCAGNSTWSSGRSTTVSPSGWVMIAGQNFEGVFPGNWIVWDDNGSNYGEYSWGKRNCRLHAGSYSGWGVGGGAQGSALSCWSTYPHNASGWMVYGPFDLQDASAGELRFKLWLYTEPDNDYVFRGASVDGVNFYGYATTGNTQGWVDKNLDLANVPMLGNLLGRSQVWVALIFSSNGSTAYAEGGYVDDVVLRQCYRECPSGSSASTSGSGQNFEASVMVTRQHGEDLGAPIVGPQPFVSPLSTPDPFRSPLPVPQP